MGARRFLEAPPLLRLRTEVLSHRQQAALTRLSDTLTESAFYLAGGTALALQLGHRRSIDLDWFCDAALPDPLRLAADIGASGIRVASVQTERGTLHASIGGVRVSFLEYRYRMLSPLVRDSASGLRLASLRDLACMKLAAVAQRGARKDFIDIFALGQRFRLAEMLGYYRRKYGVEDVGHVLFALSFFDDAEDERMPVMLRPWTWRAIKTSISRWVRENAR